MCWTDFHLLRESFITQIEVIKIKIKIKELSTTATIHQLKKTKNDAKVGGLEKS